MSRILCTGGAGYIGSVFVPKLLKDGHDVLVIDNFRYNQHTALAACCNYKNFSVINADITNIQVYKDIINDYEIIIPLAALVGAPLCERFPKEASDVNRIAVLNMVEYLKKDQLVIYPNTQSGYGITGNEPVTEDTSLLPISVYGRTKCLTEKFLLAHYNNTIVLRLATVYGMSPRMRLDLLVNDFVYKAIRDKTISVFEPHFRRSCVHIQDVASAFLFTINIINYVSAQNRKFKVFNVVSDNKTKLDLCQLINEQLPDFHPAISSSGSDPDKRDYFVDGSRLEKLGWSPSFKIEDGIEELVKGYTFLKNERYGNF